MPEQIRLRNGSLLRAQEWVLTARAGRLREVRGSELVEGDWVALRYGEGFPAQPVPLPDFPLSPSHGSQNRVRVPAALDEDLALMLGMYASEGHTTPSNYSMIITNSEEVVLQRCVELWDRCFGLTARITRQAGRCPGVIVHSKSVMEIFAALECGTRASNKRIPWPVMGSPLPVVLAFLQGLALDAYTSTTGHNAKWAICLDAPLLLDDLQLLLRWWGIRSGRIGKCNQHYGKTYDEVFVCGAEAQRLVAAVPFLEPTKTPSAQHLLARTFDRRRNGSDVVPLIRGSELYDLIPKGRSGRSGAGTGVALTWRSLTDKRTVWPSREMVVRLHDAGFPLPPDVRRVVDERLHFSVVAATG